MTSLLEAVRISIVELGERERGARGIVAPILAQDRNNDSREAEENVDAEHENAHACSRLAPQDAAAMEMRKTDRRLVGLAGSALASVLIVAAALAFVEKFHGPTAGAHDHIVHGRTAAGPADTTPPVGTGTAFHTEMAQVIARMHETMEVTPSGEPDRDFMLMMIPHHQGAIDMALVVLKYGHDERVKRVAQSIIVEQGQEITYMRTLLGAPRAEQVTSHQCCR
jgi:Domain of unknown function (DUF305)